MLVILFSTVLSPKRGIHLFFLGKQFKFCFFVATCLLAHNVEAGRRGCLVLERRTPEREVGGSILTQVPVLYP